MSKKPMYHCIVKNCFARDGCPHAVLHEKTPYCNIPCKVIKDGKEIAVSDTCQLYYTSNKPME